MFCRKSLFAAAFIFFGGFALQAAEAEIKKVLPHYLDAKGRHSLSPSLYERDAYQALLKANPTNRAALRFDVNWKIRGLHKGSKLRVEARGVKGNEIVTRTIETPLRRHGWLGNWTRVEMDAESFKEFGDLVAWRATILEGNKPIAEQKSFLW